MTWRKIDFCDDDTKKSLRRRNEYQDKKGKQRLHALYRERERIESSDDEAVPKLKRMNYHFEIEDTLSKLAEDIKSTDSDVKNKWQIIYEPTFDSVENLPKPNPIIYESNSNCVDDLPSPFWCDHEKPNYGPRANLNSSISLKFPVRPEYLSLSKPLLPEPIQESEISNTAINFNVSQNQNLDWSWHRFWELKKGGKETFKLHYVSFDHNLMFLTRFFYEF